MKRLVATLVCVALGWLVLGIAGAAAQSNFRAHLSGDEEVPPVDTLAQGEALFRLTEDGTAFEFKLIVANIEFVTQAHIHLAPRGVNGPVIAFLFGFEPGGVIVNGILAQGTISETQLGPAMFSALLDEMRAGNTYVNVHTQAFPAGEIRGQIE